MVGFRNLLFWQLLPLTIDFFSFAYVSWYLPFIYYFSPDTGKLSYLSLVVYFCVYFSLSVLTYGIAVPSGLFVPAILMGCSLGRIFGEIMRVYVGSSVHPGTYALIGAAAMLGGITRMTISLTSGSSPSQDDNGPRKFVTHAPSSRLKMFFSVQSFW